MRQQTAEQINTILRFLPFLYISLSYQSKRYGKIIDISLDQGADGPKSQIYGKWISKREGCNRRQGIYRIKFHFPER